jgi:potassium-transporting ATPase KdpC subunit
MKNIYIAIKLFVALTLITGVIYPLVITGVGNVLFSQNANGSLIIQDNKIVGSKLIGQQFALPEYFWGRPSAIGNNPMPSGGSNLNPVGSAFQEQFQARVDTIRKYHGDIDINSIPKDLLFASASGVDPHISLKAAYFQVERIVKARNFNDKQKENLIKLIESSIEEPDLYIFGEERINVLLLNLRLEKI